MTAVKSSEISHAFTAPSNGASAAKLRVPCSCLGAKLKNDSNGPVPTCSIMHSASSRVSCIAIGAKFGGRNWHVADNSNKSKNISASSVCNGLSDSTLATEV